MKKILCIHGIGYKDATMHYWSKHWENAIKTNLDSEEELEFKFLEIDELFKNSRKRMGGIAYGKAILKFLKSWIATEISGKARSIDDWLAAYAGMPAQFVTDKELRQDLFNLFKNTLEEFQPDIIYAQSLGSLLAYDYLKKESVNGKSFPIVLLTSGSQISHPALLTEFGGQITTLNVKIWINLHNENDRIFASRKINVKSQNFIEINTPFNHKVINHEALEYLNHPNAINIAWPLINENIKSKVKNKNIINIDFINTKAIRKANKKALLIGINDYPIESYQLEGCLNDVYRISEVLQENGFNSDEIKVVTNNRATAEGIRERMHWLLDDVIEKDIRFLYFSGHGAQIPPSNNEFELDGHDECLVPYDFDWSTEKAFTDKEFVQFYSQLPYNSEFISVFDCCHSGGISRNGGLRIKGVTPPDDIRHREIKWDVNRQMWIPRELDLSKNNLFDKKDKNISKYIGQKSNIYKLGRGVSLWGDIYDFENAKKTYLTNGAFNPIVLQACAENEYAYEYRHGVTSFGAFTYAFTTRLRQYKLSNSKASLSTLVAQTSDLLKELQFNQKPQIVGPKAKINNTNFIY